MDITSHVGLIFDRLGGIVRLTRLQYQQQCRGLTQGTGLTILRDGHPPIQGMAWRAHSQHAGFDDDNGFIQTPLPHAGKRSLAPDDALVSIVFDIPPAE